jgi:hypothetical protein
LLVTCLLHLGGTFLVRVRFFECPSFVRVTSPNKDQVSQHAPLSEWIETAQDEKLWNDIIDEWHEVTCQVSFTDFEL